LKPRRTISLISLGCPKNLVDSEGLVSTLISRGFQVLREPEEADLVLVNTCGFLDASRQESLEVIRDAVALKKKGVHGVLVTGCMVGNFKALLDKEAPGVDRLVSFQEYRQIDRIADEILPPTGVPEFTVDRRRMDIALTPAHYSYLKISEGCNHTCAFCIIPDIRGPMHSFSTDDLVSKARVLAARGVKEICLIAQDSTVYGADLYGEIRLPRLLERLQEIDELRWIRLMYAYPTEVTPLLADTLAQGGRILPYLDVPVQHAANRILQRMRRGYGRSRLEQMIDLLRERSPDLALRTTVIVGFPGETEADFQELLDFVKDARFDRLGAFRYSREPGSAAADLDDHLPDEVKEERFARLMTLQQSIAFASNEGRVGTQEEVLVDHAAGDGQPARARTRRDAPEVDSAVLIGEGQVLAGDMLTVEITGTEGYDLRAVPVS